MPKTLATTIMSQLVLTHRSRLNRILNERNTPSISIRAGKFFLISSLTILIGLVGFLYMVKFTEIHTKGYAVKKLEIERDELLSEREHQRKDIESLKSMQSVREATQYLVVPRKVTFVREESGLARR